MSSSSRKKLPLEELSSPTRIGKTIALGSLGEEKAESEEERIVHTTRTGKTIALGSLGEEKAESEEERIVHTTLG